MGAVIGVILLGVALSSAAYCVQRRASEMLNQAILSAEVRPVLITPVASPTEPTSVPTMPAQGTMPANMPAVTSTPVVIVSIPSPTPAPAPRLPDFTILAMGILPPSPIRGQPITAWIQGINRGSAAAVNIRVRVDLEREVFGAWIPVISVWGTVERLGPGESTSMKRSATIPDQVPPGRYRVTVEIDPDRAVLEANVANNRSSLEFMIQ